MFRNKDNFNVSPNSDTWQKTPFITHCHFFSKSHLHCTLIDSVAWLPVCYSVSYSHTSAVLCTYTCQSFCMKSQA